MLSRPAADLRVWTDAHARIVDVTDDLAELLNLSRQGCVGRPMHLFMDADRAGILRAVETAARGHLERFEGVLRPRSHQPVRVAVILQVEANLVRWNLAELAD